MVKKFVDIHKNNTFPMFDYSKVVYSNNYQYFINQKAQDYF